jgi:hypothetical protein
MVGRDLAWAKNDETIALGHLLAPMAVRYIVLPVGSGVTSAASARLSDALVRQTDLVLVGIDPSFEVFANSVWVPLFSVLDGPAPAPAGSAAWGTAYQLQQLHLRAAQPLPVGSASTGSFSVTVNLPTSALYGAVPDGSWRVDAGGRSLTGRAVAGGGTAWAVPAGKAEVVISRTSAFGQHLADLVMLLLWAVALMSLARLPRSSTGLRIPRLDLGLPGEEVSEIDWPAVSGDDDD